MQAWKRYTQNELNTSNPIKNTIYIYERCIIEFKKLDKALE
ncbi:TPA: flagellar protein FliS, partial [Listeria monocytogenes]|nr:flagellar protein FliS [Listeria monocytogenes]HAK1428925.1 flagellar protein FliS [Listeria monocytogenes]HEM1864395.1 flagellar protein FliS [Listeria monocytogenes]